MFNSIKSFFKDFFQAEDEASAPTPEELSKAFKVRYHHFRLLLNANQKALETMSELEQAMRGFEPFGMGFVRAGCTAISTSVYQIIKNLDALAPDQYTILYSRFKDIQNKINPHVFPVEEPVAGPMVLGFGEMGIKCSPACAEIVGAKMANLGEVASMGLDVPDGFVVTASGYARFLEHAQVREEIFRRMQAAGATELDELYALSSDLQKLIIDSGLPPDLESEIYSHFDLMAEKHGPDTRVAIRSSALCEDLAGVSFAGQFDSELNVSRENIIQVFKEIVASKYSPQAMAYRLSRGVREKDVAMCVGFMIMVDAVAGGVMYTGNPMDRADNAIAVNSVWGLPKAIVDGSAPSDFLRISRDSLEIIEKNIAHKPEKFVCNPEEGVGRVAVDPDLAGEPSVTGEQCRKLAEIALNLEDHYGGPQDIEWAVGQGGEIYILQTRPLEVHEKSAAVKPDVPPEMVLISGSVGASGGTATGVVYVVRRNADILSFPDGGILAVEQALPRWAALANRASGVVARRGSVAGHLATVCREFGVPSVFGVGDGFDLLENGRTVTVDGDLGAVYKGEVGFRPDARPKNIMRGSGVLLALKNAGEHIFPLNLMDPESPEFRAKNCATMHDITRFCHEQAVREMFRFGSANKFPKHSSKQLVVEVPMQFWIINLDDGFVSEVKGDYVGLPQIASIPMLALWKGMVAVPWEGPAINAGGFMSVLMESTMNPSLDPTLYSNFSVKNYFMLSKNFATLQSKFGYHFCSAEALVSERDIQNYASFRFKGGAADISRRRARVKFIGEVMQEFGFGIKISEDSLAARVEGLHQNEMEEKLRIVGYLITHTRQVDMIMADADAVASLRAKMLKDIGMIIAAK